MIKIFSKVTWHLFKQEFLTMIVVTLSIVSLNIFLGILTYNQDALIEFYKSRSNMPIKEYQIFYSLYGNGLMGLQGYIFGYTFLSLFLIVYLLISAFMFKKVNEKTIVLVKNKNVENTVLNNIYYFSIFVICFIQLIVVIGLTYCISIIGNNILNIGIPLFIVDYHSYINSIVALVIELFLFFAQIKKTIKSNNLLKVVRSSF